MIDVRVLQLAYGDEESPGERLARVSDLVRAERGADLIVLPELWMVGAFNFAAWERAAVPIEGPTVTALCTLAAEVGVTLHAGSILERDPATSLMYNTALLIDSSGEIKTKYRKVHRFGFQDGEAARLTSGDRLAAPDLSLGRQSVRVGLATCYDLRFPEMFRMLSMNGMQLAIVVAAWPASRVEHWRLLCRARAVENQVALVGCNTAGTHAGIAMGGRSMVVDPLGVVLAEAGEEQQVLHVRLDLSQVSALRQTFPVLADRRM